MTARTSGGSSPSTDEGAVGQRYALDRGARRLADGRVLLGGEPFRIVRLGERGAAVLDALLERRGAPCTTRSESGSRNEGGSGSDGGSASRSGSASGSERELVERLVAAGLLHPRPPRGGGACDCFRLAVVVPVRDAPPTLAPLVEGLTGAGLEVNLVDDGSSDGGETVRRLAGRTGAAFLLRPSSGGPAAARNSARSLIRNCTGNDDELIAFLDADTIIEPDEMSRWISHCAALFHDRRVGLVAPRVAAASSGPHVARGRRRTSARAIARYEETESPLDLGPDPGLVGAGHRLSYAPAAALVLRRRALDEVGWFDETLRYGEDVDLVRRLGDAGWMCRYEPSAVVGHVGRGSLRAFIWQRACYGSSAAALDRRHPGTLAPFSAAPTITAAAVGVVALVTGIRRHPARALAEPPAGTFATALATALAAALAGTSSAVVVRRLARALHKAGCPAATRQATAVTGRSVLGSALWLLTAFRRAWWPICLPLVVGGGRRIRRRFAVMAAVSLMCGHGPEAARDARRHGAKAAVTHLVLGAMDDAAYTSGVWWGCARERSLGALLPQIRGISGNSGTSRISRISGIRGTRTGRRAR